MIYKEIKVETDSLYVVGHPTTDTVVITKGDTVRLYITRVDTAIKHVIKTITNECKSKFEIKYQYKTIRDTVRIREKAEVKKEKIQAVADVRKTRIENRSWFWTFVLIGIAFILGYLTRKRLNQ